MDQLAEQNRYWIISFTSDDAHVIETKQGDGPSKPLRTLRVHYRDLKYKYMDIEKEARRLAEAEKNQVDPRILLDKNNSIEYILSLPQIRDREDKEFFVDMLKHFREGPDDFHETYIRKYDDAQKKTLEELYLEIRGGLEEKRDYVPKEIGNLTQGELSLGLPGAGYITGTADFTTLDDALSALYYRWEDIWNDIEKVKYMEELEGFAVYVAQERMSKIFGGLF